MLDNKNEIWRYDLQRGSKVIIKVLEQMQTYAETMTPNSTTNTIELNLKSHLLRH